MMNEWDIRDITGADTIRLTEGELLLMDWIICSGSSLLTGKTLDDLVEDTWHELRLRIWSAIHGPRAEPLGEMFQMDQFTAKVLLAAGPTTHTWGDGVDYGYMLKLNLARFLAGIYVDPLIHKAEVEAEAERVKAEAAAEQERNTALAARTSARTTRDGAWTAAQAKRKESKEASKRLKETDVALQAAEAKLKELGYADEDQAGDDTQDQAGTPAV